MTIQEILNTDIRELKLCARALNVLSNITATLNRKTGRYEEKGPFTTVLDIMNLSRQDLLEYRNLGRKTTFEIQDTIIEFIANHIDTFAQFNNQELEALGLKDVAFNEYLRFAWPEDQQPIPPTKSAIKIKEEIRKSATQSKIDIRKKEIAEYYAAIDDLRKRIAEKEFEISELQKQQKIQETSENKR